MFLPYFCTPLRKREEELVELRELKDLVVQLVEHSDFIRRVLGS